MTEQDVERIKEVLDRFIWDDRSVKRNELLEILESLKVTSPKTGKLISTSTYIQYNERRMLKELNKRDMAWYLNNFLRREQIVPAKYLRGFFTA